MQQEFKPNVHKCELTFNSDLAFPSFVPPLVRSSKCFEKLKQLCLISDRHPKCLRWVDSMAGVRRERKRQCLLPDWWIIHPFSTVKFVWEIVMTLVYAVAFVSIPFRISFVVLNYERVRLDRTNFVIYAFFWLDICFNCITGVKNKKEMVVDLRQTNILISYIRGFLLIDIFTSLNYDYITYEWRNVPGPDSSVLVAIINLVPLLKLLRYITFHSYILQLFLIKDYNAQILSTLLFSLYVIHWFACLCYVTQVLILYVQKITVDECDNCWLSSIAKEDIPARYRHALFIVLQNFVASGFGAIEPKSPDHKVVCSVLMILGRIFEAYIVIMFLQIKAGSKASESKYQEITNQLSAYARQKQLAPYMTKRLLAYYNHRFGKSYFREKTILSGLSEQLRKEILLHSCRRLVENVAIFKSLPKEILATIVANLIFELYLPNDMIVKAGTPGDCMFFLARGTVAVLTPTGKEVCHLDDGAHFGEIALLVQDQRRVASVVAIEICDVYRLDRKDFRKCIAIHGDLFAKIERIATERMQRTIMIEEQDKRSLTSTSRAMNRNTKRGWSRSGK